MMTIMADDVDKGGRGGLKGGGESKTWNFLKDPQ